MAGHSHWAGIKHKKGKTDKQRSRIFSKLSKEITVAAKIGSQDPETNFRLRHAIQMAKNSNMPKNNIERAINRSRFDENINYESIRYEGFGPEKIAVIIETLTDNKNRTVSNLRKIFQKHGGSLGASGVASHLFEHVGILRIKKNQITEDILFEMAIESGAKDCNSLDDFYEIITDKNEFYTVKKNLEKKVLNFLSSQIEWRPLNFKNIQVLKIKTVNDFINMLEDDEDVQLVFSNHQINEKLEN